MPSNNFNLGRDTKVIVVHPFAGGRLDLQKVVGFHAKQGTAAIKVTDISGETTSAHIPQDWTGTIDIERANAALDRFIAALELAWFNGENVPPGQIYQYVTEVSGARSSWQFTKVSFFLSEAGSWKADATVKQSLGFTSARRLPV